MYEFNYSEVITIKKMIAAAVCLIVVSAAAFYLKSRNAREYSDTFFALDTLVSVRMSEDLTSTVREEIHSCDRIFDMYSETSELHELNTRKTLACSEPLFDIISRILTLNEKYGYSLDITSGNLSRLWHDSLEKGVIPGEDDIRKYKAQAGPESICAENGTVTLRNDVSVDLGSAAKGYILDRLYTVISSEDPEYAAVSFGSSALLYSSSSEHVFNVIIRSADGGSAGTAGLKGTWFVSTSGNYERFTEIDGVKYHHITDLETGYPADGGLTSVTVFCRNGLLSDFLSTLIFIGGKDSLDRYLESGDFLVAAADEEGNIYKSSSLEFIPS